MIAASLFTTAAGAEASASVAPLLRPAMKLYGIVSPGGQNLWGPDANSTDWTNPDVSLASALEFVYGGGLSNATSARLAGKTHRIKYKNYGGSDPGAVADVEVSHHGDVAYYSPGLLASPLPADGTSFLVFRAPHTPHEPQLPWDSTRPGGLVASTSPTDHTVLADPTKGDGR